MNTLRKLGLCAAAATTLLAVPSAHAQTVAKGFALQRFSPGEMGSEWFAADSLDIRGSGRFALGFVLDYAHKPLVIFDGDGNELVAPIKYQAFAHLGASVNIASRLRLAVSVPIGMTGAGTEGIFDNLTYRVTDGVALGDVRAAADVALIGEDGDPFRLALGVQAYFPTGKRDAYTGDSKFRIIPRLAAAGDAGLFAYALQVGFNGRLLDENFGSQPLGNTITFGAAAGLRIGDVLLGPEAYGETSIKKDKFLKGPNTPAEVLFGVHWAITESWRLGVGAGHGFTTAIGSPDIRVLAGLTYYSPLPEEPALPPPPPPPPPLPPPDRDHDGVLDIDDACPDEPGLVALKGCPDTDKDGITDKEDACPKEAGPRNDNPAKNGCPPPPDTDKDGILDADDACPDVAGDADPDPKKNGCPKVRITKGAIEILERIEFDTGKATLRPESDPLLAAIRRALAEHPEIRLVRLEGYTDSRGKPAFNLKLSQARVDSVMAWLTDHGIEPERMIAKGFGKASPVATNNTDEGRQRNRRVQIVIMKQDETELK